MVDKLLEERGQEYGEAWKIAGWMLETIGYKYPLFIHSPYAHNFVLILSKLCRALHTPYNKDHWVDIIGYATLVLQDIEKGEQDEAND